MLFCSRKRCWKIVSFSIKNLHRNFFSLFSGSCKKNHSWNSWDIYLLKTFDHMPWLSFATIDLFLEKAMPEKHTPCWWAYLSVSLKFKIHIFRIQIAMKSDQDNFLHLCVNPTMKKKYWMENTRITSIPHKKSIWLISDLTRNPADLCPSFKLLLRTQLENLKKSRICIKLSSKILLFQVCQEKEILFSNPSLLNSHQLWNKNFGSTWEKY